MAGITHYTPTPEDLADCEAPGDWDPEDGFYNPRGSKKNPVRVVSAGDNKTFSVKKRESENG
jgi:hypothetical protein